MTDHRPFVVSLCVAAALAGACSKKPADSAAAATSSAQPAPAAPAGVTAGATSTGAPAAAVSHETAGAPAGQPAAAAPTATGTVVETMDAANYTYVRVKTEAGELWAASGQFKVKVGDRVVVPLEGAMENFHSQTLKRDFPLIYFASQITHEGETPTALPPGHKPIDPNASAAVAAVTEPIAQPAGGTTVAKVWADRKALSGKPVTVRGKVVKFNGGIMDRNWMHIQDGSGKAADNTNDLTITMPTDQGARVGDIVTITGKVGIDRDFGAGYAYPVIVEGASVSPK